MSYSANLYQPPITAFQEDINYIKYDKDGSIIHEDYDDYEDYDGIKIEKSINNLLGKKTLKNKTLEQEVIEKDIYNLYDNLRLRFDNLSPNEKGRYFILQGIIKMVKFDPINGDKPNIMTNEAESQQEYWYDLEDDFRRGYSYLVHEGNMKDLISEIIPRTIRHKVEMLFSEMVYPDG